MIRPPVPRKAVELARQRPLQPSLLQKENALKTISPLDAALAWSTLGFKWWETMAASSRVIARRTRRKPTPARLLRMGSEKMEAAFESSNAMAQKMIGFPVQDPMTMWGAWARVLASGLAPYHSRVTRNARPPRP